MGTLLVHAEGRVMATPLAPSTLVGRHAGCLARIDDLAVPLYWLEVRWLGEGAAGMWAWRAMGAVDTTRGSGTPLHDGWRAMACVDGRGTRVSLAADLSVELVDAEPPAPFVVDLATGAPVEGDALEELVEVRSERLLPLEAEGDTRRALSDGDVFVVEGRAYRAHAPSPVAGTLAARIDLRRPGIRLDVDLPTLTATVSQGKASVVVRGECVRVLALYRSARGDDLPRGGWLSPTDAHEGWLELGGALASTLARVGWERSKLRSRLARAGVTGLDALFEVRHDRDGFAVRLAERW